MRFEDEVRLRHMRDAAHAVLSFVQNRTREDLDKDLQLVWALVKGIEIIGEAACQVSTEARAKLPEIPWDKIIGMRHRLVHAYFDINLDILWKTVLESIPPLYYTLSAILGKK
jgi:uncharacterized protein with HEPN domain